MMQELKKKHAKLASELSTSSDRAKVEAVVVDSLGSWDVKNDKIVKRLCALRNIVSFLGRL